MKKLLASILFIGACSIVPNPMVTAPLEDSVESEAIWFESSSIFVEMFGCEAEPIYEKYQDNGIYIGVIGWCTEAAVGVYYFSGGGTNGMKIETP